MNVTNDSRFLSTFKLEVASGAPLIYRNNRQQLKIVVTYRTVGDIDLTEAEFDSLRLVTTEGGDYEELSEQFSVSTVRDERFAYYPATQPRSLKATHLETPEKHKTFYISSAHEAGIPIKLCAAIDKDDDGKGTKTYVSGTSIFKSVVEIQTVEPAQVTRESFIFTGHDFHQQVSEGTFTPNVTYDLDFYELTLKRPNKIESSWMAEESEVNFGEIWYQGEYWPGFFGGYYQHAHRLHSVGEQDVPDLDIKPSRLTTKNTLLFKRVKSYTWETIHNLWVSSTSINTDKRCICMLRDRYGNTHKIQLSTKANGNIPDFKVIEEHYRDV